MSNTKNRGYKYLDTSEEARKRGLRRISRPAFVDNAIKANKNRITIMLDADIIEHFKSQAEATNLGYQTLINQALREKIAGSASSNALDELLNDKKALKRLKAKLESV